MFACCDAVRGAIDANDGAAFLFGLDEQDGQADADEGHQSRGKSY
jgi:hypothetical protein